MTNIKYTFSVILTAKYNGVFAKLDENKGVFPILTWAKAFFNLILGRKMKINNTPKLTLFHCLKSFEETATMFDGCQAKTIKMACSSMTKDVHLLRAFEAGADAVIVLVCNDTGCRFAEGSRRAKKRVDYVKTILDDIGMDGRRLNFFNTTAKDTGSINEIIQDTLESLEAIGPNPALTRLN